jgi:hypothetical protein
VCVGLLVRAPEFEPSLLVSFFWWWWWCAPWDPTHTMRPDDARQLSLDFLGLDYAYLLYSDVVWNARVSRSGVPGKPE